MQEVTSPRVTGCQPCPSSNFTNDCDLCTLEGCQMSCQSCLATNTPANRTGGPPTNLTIPAGGCEVFNLHSELICIPGTEGACPIGQPPVYQQFLASTHDCYHPELGIWMVVAQGMQARSWCLNMTVQSLTIVCWLYKSGGHLTMPLGVPRAASTHDRK